MYGHHQLFCRHLFSGKHTRSIPSSINLNLSTNQLIRSLIPCSLNQICLNIRPFQPSFNQHNLASPSPHVRT